MKSKSFQQNQLVQSQLHSAMMHLQSDLHIHASELIHVMARLQAVELLFAPFPMARFSITHYNKWDFCTVHISQGVQSVQL